MGKSVKLLLFIASIVAVFPLQSCVVSRPAGGRSSSRPKTELTGCRGTGHRLADGLRVTGVTVKLFPIG